jgi:hypothetical protein
VSDWPFVERKFVIDQLDELMTIPLFAGDAFSAMENGNAAPVQAFRLSLS